MSSKIEYAEFTEVEHVAGAFGGGDVHEAVVANDTLRSDGIVTIIDLISEGEIEGFAKDHPLKCVYFNETVAMQDDGKLTFKNKIKAGTPDESSVLIDFRPGTPGQTPYDDEENGVSSAPFVVNQELLYNQPVTRTISGQNVDAVRVGILLPQGLSVQEANGDIKEGQVKIDMWVSSNNGPFVAANVGTYVRTIWEVARSRGNGDAAKWDWQTQTIMPLDQYQNPQFYTLAARTVPADFVQIKGKASAAYVRDYIIKLSQFGPGPYQVKVQRRDQNPTTSGSPSTVNFTTWKDYQEIVYSKLQYPYSASVRNQFSARDFKDTPTRGYHMKGIKVRVPTNYDGHNRNTTGFWDGNFKIEYTTNPVWCLLDLLTNPIYGLGDKITLNSVDKWQFYDAASYCDDFVTDGKGGFERRFSLNLYIQQQGDAAKVISDIADAFNAKIFWQGGKVQLIVDRPKTPKQLFSPANVINGTFVYTSTEKGKLFSKVAVRWADPDNYYKLAVEYVDDPEMYNKVGHQEATIAPLGCATRAQAHRAGLKILADSKFENDIISFQLSYQALTLTVGDLFIVNDPLKSANINLRTSGRLKNTSTANSLVLDSPIDVANFTHVFLTDPSNGIILQIPLTTLSGTISTIPLGTALTFTPDDVCMWAAVNSVNIEQRTYRTLQISAEEDSKFTVTAVRYRPEKYAMIDSNVVLEEPKRPITKNPLLVLAPENLTAKRGMIMGENTYTKVINIGWTPPNENNIIGYKLNIRYEGTIIVSMSTTELSYQVRNVKTGLYEIDVQTLGSLSAISPPASVEIFVNDAFNITDLNITNLSLKNGGTTFVGKNAEFKWETDLSTLMETGSGYSTNGFSTGQGASHRWFRDFEVRVYTTGDVLRRTEYTETTDYVYTFEKNVEDGGTPLRNIKIKVRARDEFGVYSNEATLSVSNPPPGNAFTGVNIAAGLGQVFIKYNPPADPDYQFTNIYMGTTAGFTPSAGNLVASGSDLTTSVKTTVNGLHYFVFQGIDEFGISGATYSSEYNVFVNSDLTVAVDEVLADPGRAGDVVVEATRFLVTQPGQTTPKTAVFGVGLVNGTTKVGIKGELLVDGSVTGQSIVGNTIVGNHIVGTTLSAIKTSTGTLTIDTSGWLKTNGKTYGSATAGVFLGYDAGAYKFDVGTNSSYLRFNGTSVEATGLTIKNAAGTTILSSTTVPNDILNSQITLSTLGFTGDTNATYGANTGNITAGFGTNVIKNAAFTNASTEGWTFAQSGHTATLGINNTSYKPVGGDAPYMYQNNSTSSGYSDFMCSQIPVIPNKRYEAYCYLGVHRCTASTFIGFFNAAGGALGYTQFTTISGVTGGTSISNFAISGGYATAPTNSAYAVLFVRKYGTLSGNTDSFCFLTQPFFAEAGVAQNTFSPWNPGDAYSKWIGFDKIANNNIVNYMAAGAIGGTYIQNLAVTTGHIVDLNVTTGKMGIASVDTLRVAGGAITATDVVVGTSYWPDIPNAADAATGFEEIFAAITLPVVDIATKRIITIRFEYGNLEQNPGRLLLKLYWDNNGTGATWTSTTTYSVGLISKYNNNFLGAGIASDTKTITFVFDAPAGSGPRLHINTYLQNGYGAASQRWNAGYGIIITSPTIICQTAKR